MSDYDRGAYAPPSDAPLAFDAREPRGRRPAPVSLILGLIVLAVLAGALALLYRGGVRDAGEGPPTVGDPVERVSTPATGEAAAPAASPGMRLDVYETREPAASGQAVAAEPTFTPPPEAPLPRTAATAPVVAPASTDIQPASPTPTTGAPPRALRPAFRPDVPATAPPVVDAPDVGRAPPAPTIDSLLRPSAQAGATAGAVSVQIGAFSSEALANSQLSAVRSATPGGGGVRVEPLERNGSTLYRGLVTGFGSRAEARAYCTQLQASGRSCLVR